MNVKKIIAAMSAAALAGSMMAMTASATKLSDLVYPSETETDKNDGWYSVGAMGYYMSQQWKWNQGEWCGITDDGKIEISYSINEVLTDTTMEGKGTLGDMGVMVCNLPEEGYPYDVTISDAKFVTNDGEEIVLDSVNAITLAEADKESGFRIHIRPTDEVDEETGEVTLAARPEVAGWDQEGAFKGGTLSMTIDFGAPAAAEPESQAESQPESKADESKTESKDESKTESKEESKTESKAASSTAAKSATTASTTAASSAAADTTSDNTNQNTGAAAGTIFALMALGAAGAVAAKKRK
ncbi:NPXTG-anchored protein [Ruminococcus sp.]|uniref:NPXTG-anchored protein n=1 Tax=Ruminococcus sp. TaxID=41978 RepID=UPI0025D8D26C|nr:NPXTG-anchored protein [Ruminococcus sp.]MBQ8967007.1 NPXTG-anchored protein [Ruminococcus sp.]